MVGACSQLTHCGRSGLSLSSLTNKMSTKTLSSKKNTLSDTIDKLHQGVCNLFMYTDDISSRVVDKLKKKK